jgi:hypothetical protein
VQKVECNKVDPNEIENIITMSLDKIQTPEITIEIKEIHEHEWDFCNKLCEKEQISYPCYDRNKTNLPNPKNPILNTRIIFIVSNITSKEYRIYDNYFTLVDTEGFSHKGLHFCEKYSMYNNAFSYHHDISPQSKIYFQVLFYGIDEKGKASRISYKKDGDGEVYSLHLNKDDISDSDLQKNVSLYEIINGLNEKIETLEYENNELKNQKKEERRTVADLDSLVKYRTKQDDEYFYIISDEKECTMSFNREFDKSKENYNWINTNDALITMRLDNVEYLMNYPTKIKSPVSGIFEFEKNKLIQYGEVVCRIKLYEQSRKQEIIEKLEEKDIKDAVYKKERKKKIEREALDELISKGLVFNSYITKEGNRSTIPIDVSNAVWNRDGGRCVMCGSREKLEFDHIIPVSKGGSSTYRNLQLLCENCNRKKSDNIG